MEVWQLDSKWLHLVLGVLASQSVAVFDDFCQYLKTFLIWILLRLLDEAVLLLTFRSLLVAVSLSRECTPSFLIKSSLVVSCWWRLAYVLYWKPYRLFRTFLCEFIIKLWTTILRALDFLSFQVCLATYSRGTRSHSNLVVSRCHSSLQYWRIIEVMT